MKMLASVFVCPSSLCVFLILFTAHSYGAKLNEPKVLLPYFSKSPSSYQIEINEAARGCFKW